MKNNHLIILLIAWICSVGTMIPARGQEPAEKLVLNLQEAVDHAIAYNKTLQNARLELERSEKSIWEAIAQGLPQVDGTVNYMSYFNYAMEFNFGGGAAPDLSPEDLQNAFDQTQTLFPSYTQGDVLTHAANTYYDGVLSDMIGPTAITLKDQSTATLQVSQLIFSGQYIVGVQTAKLAKKIAGQNLEFNEQNIKESVINAYYLVLITEESLGILKQNLENLQETLEQTQIMFRTGMAEQTDVDQISITVNQLANATASLQRNLELNYNMLRFQLGLESNVELQLTDNLESLFVEQQPETALALPFELEDNVNYQIMQTQEQINERLLDLEQWNYAPTIAGFYNYNKKLLVSGFDMNPNHLVGLNMSIPIFSSGMRKARVDQARIEYNIAQNNLDLLQDQLLLQEKQIKYNLQSSLENYYTQQENVEVAQRVYDSYRRKFQQGMATSLDLTNANSNYLDAESNYLTAMMDVMNARLQLDKLMNRL